MKNEIILWDENGNTLRDISLTQIHSNYKTKFEMLGKALIDICNQYNIEPTISINIKYKRIDNNGTNDNGTMEQIKTEKT